MDPAYVFAAVVIGGGILGIGLLIWRLSKNAPVLTPFSPDRNYWWDGVAWKPVLSDDGKWASDSYGWQPHIPETATTSQRFAAGLLNTNPASKMAVQVLMTVGIMAVLVSLGKALGYEPSARTISFSTLIAIAAVGWWTKWKGGWGSPPKKNETF